MNWIICSVHLSQLMFGSFTSVSNSRSGAGARCSHRPSTSTGGLGFGSILPETEIGPRGVSRVTSSGSAGSSARSSTDSATR